MSSFAQTIINLASDQELKVEAVHPYYVEIHYPFNAPPLAVGMLDEKYVEFEISVPPDFVLLNKIPDHFSKFLLTRNFPDRIGHWTIEYGQNSQVYYYAFRFVTLFSSLNQLRFDNIVSEIEEEFKLYWKNVTGGKAG